MQPVLPWFALPVVVGAAWPAALGFPPVLAWWLGAPLLLALAWWTVRDHPWAARAVIAALGGLLGLWLGWSVRPVGDGTGTRLVEVTGTVTQVAWQDRSQGFALAGDHGRWFVRAGMLPAVQPGDQVVVRGRWSADVRGPVVHASEVERTVAREDGPRGWAWRALERLGAHRELGQSLILGRGNPPEKEAFRQAGLLHLLAVSGAHLAIAAALGAWLLRHAGVPWLARQLALGLLVAGYAWLTDGSPATIRALAMALAILVYDLTAREAHPLGPVALAALVLVVLDPGMGDDLGFQLSLAAVLGIVTLGQELIAWRSSLIGLQPWPLDRPLWRALLWVARGAADGLAIGIAAAFATMPIVAWWFTTCAPWTPLTTLVATVPTTFALWLGLPLVGLAGLWPGGPWEPLYRLVEANLAAMAGTVTWAASLPGATVAARPPVAAVLVWPLIFVPGPRWWGWLRLVLALTLIATTLGNAR
jgi:ComEC/Rec2-related protein